MGKKFLDILGDAFEEDVLDDVIPTPRKKKTVKPANNRRKKRFIHALEENLPEEEPQVNKKRTKGTKTSLLDTLEEALDNQVFDDLFPARPRKRKAGTPLPPPDPNLEIRFSTMITSEVLERAREIATTKGIRVKEVINIALQLYIDKEAD